MSQAAVDHYLSEFNRARTESGDWFAPQRRSAIQSLSEQGFPGTRQEGWRYTDVRPITNRQFVSAPAGTVTTAGVARFSYADRGALELVFVNGHYQAALSAIGNLPAGVTIQPLSRALLEHRELLEQSFARHTAVGKSGFTALNTAFVTEGVLIHIADRCVLEQPVNLLYLSTRDSQPHVSHLRSVIILGSQAQATIVESYNALDETEYFNNTTTQITIGAGAVLQHYRVQQESPLAFHINSTSTVQLRDSRLESHAITIGGGLVRNDLDIELGESGAEAVLNGLYIADGRQHIDNHTCINHARPHTRSDEHYRGVLNGSARGVFNGRVIVQKDAQKTEAHQANANLLLSNDAEVDTKPELEIYADDVKCSHGATVGQLDENMLFYLRSRAIDKQTAISLLTFAFAEEIVRRIGFAPIRERVEQSVIGKLPDAGLIRDFIQ